MSVKPFDPKAWAAALGIILTALVAFFSSPNWQIALVVTGVIVWLAWQEVRLHRCMQKHGDCVAELHRRDLSIAWLYLLAEQNSGRRQIPQLDLFLGPGSQGLLAKVRELVGVEAPQDPPHWSRAQT